MTIDRLGVSSKRLSASRGVIPVRLAILGPITKISRKIAKAITTCKGADTHVGPF
jgi:hypothetical protein